MTSRTTNKKHFSLMTPEELLLHREECRVLLAADQAEFAAREDAKAAFIAHSAAAAEQAMGGLSAWAMARVRGEARTGKTFARLDAKGEMVFKSVFE